MQKLKDIDGFFYDSAWEEWNDMIYYSPAPRIRRAKIISRLKKISFNSLLDVGCGNGEFLREVNNTLPNKKLAGADISSAVIEANRARIQGADFFVLDLNQEVLPRRFDVVVCMEVIEHCADYGDAIKRLAEMTGEYLFITVPCGPLFEIDRRVGHTRHFHGEEIRTALKQAGLHMVKIQNWGFPFFNLYKYVINLWPDKMCESFLSTKEYSQKQKRLSTLIYATFKTSLPFGGYQLFAVALRQSRSKKIGAA